MIAAYPARMLRQSHLIRVLRALATPRVASGALLVAIAVQLSITSRDLLAARSAPVPLGRLVKKTPVHSSADIRSIAAAHLFGLEQGPVDTQVADAPQTSAPLSLTGVVAAGSSGAGAAIVGPAAGATRFVSVGKEVAPGITLQAVYADRVVLSRGGQLESLALPHGPGGMLIGMAPMSGERQSPAEADDSAAQDSGTSAEQISSKIATATAGLSQVLTARGAFEPQGNGYRGVIVQPGPDAELFAQLGFHPGDLITHINGLALDDPSLLTALKSGATVRVGVRRDGGTEVIAVNTASLRGYTHN